MEPLLVLVHAGATWFMVGLIWFVQVVHYPLLGSVPKDEHVRRTTLVVAPPMILELVSAVALAAMRPGIPAYVGLALLGGIWFSTAFVQVPLHRRLQEAGGERVLRRLVRTNSVRTVAWSVRGVLALAMVTA